MKRKGFTLVELLIIVAIIGALAATMTVSTGSSIAKSKATTIANNLRVCTSGAQLYYLANGDTSGIDSITTKTMLKAAVPNFSDFVAADGNIQYVSDDGAGPSNWKVTVNVTGTDATNILTALKAIKGFNNIDTSKGVEYKVFEGTATAASN